MRRIPAAALAATLAACALAAHAGLSARQEGTRVRVRGDHFRLTVDRARGGEITQLSLFDGSGWNRVLGGDGQTCPRVSLADGQARYTLAHDRTARIADLATLPGKVRLVLNGVSVSAPRRGGRCFGRDSCVRREIGGGDRLWRLMGIPLPRRGVLLRLFGRWWGAGRWSGR